MSLVRRLPAIPVFHPGSGIQTIHIDDLCAAIANALDLGIAGSFAIAHPKPVLIRDFYRIIAKSVGRDPVLVPMPGDLCRWILSIPERFGVSLPITSENLLGLKYARPFETAQDLRTLGVAVRSFEESVRFPRGTGSESSP